MITLYSVQDATKPIILASTKRMVRIVKRRFRRLKWPICILWCFLPFMSYVGLRTVYSVLEIGSAYSPGHRASCLLPHLDINNLVISSFFKKVPPLECNTDPDWICVRNGRISLCDPNRHPSVLCNYSFFQRLTDHENVIHTTVANSNGPVDLATDFFNVVCQSNNSRKNTWHNVMAGVRIHKTIQTNSTFDRLGYKAMKLNVFMFGYDSLSRLTFMRKLPKTYDYLRRELGAVVLEGYNIVGDGTPQALIPIFTGQTEVELPETRKRKENSEFVNVYPFIWKEFKQQGYVTGFAEDCPSLGIFTYRLKGFGEQPTDHYMRPFYLEMEKVKSTHKTLCLGSRPRHKVMMDYVEDFFDVYKNNPKFFFGFHGELSHDDLNLIGVADNDTLNMLKHLKEKSHLENTMLLFMSDHGPRFASIRDTQQGKQEERLPFFSISLPTWFKTKYPIAWKNLVTNSRRLTSPFDIYPTLRSILHYDDRSTSSVKTRSISLFEEVPENRTCEDANIETHWCACLSWEPESLNSPVIQAAAQALVNHINHLTTSETSECELLTLSSIQRAERYVPHSDLLKFKKSADLDGFVADFSDSTAISTVIYQVKIVTSPGSGHFEASLMYDTSKRTFKVRTDMISRTNTYGDDPICIKDTFQDLRKYCYCKKKRSGQTKS